MEVIRNPADLSRQIIKLKAEGQTIGFVPTMGALHQGHINLIDKAVEENDIAVASIFINPLQFNNVEDLALYPRSENEDLEKLEKIGCHFAFLPHSDEIYREKTRISLDFGELANKLEGKFRPGHFNGVGIVVAKLFHIVIPDQAYFGLKDLQQCAIVKLLVEDLSFPLRLRLIETTREDDGLAMSSRNKRLTEIGRKQASYINLALKHVRENLPSMAPQAALFLGIEYLKLQGLNNVEYLEIVDFETMQPIKEVNSKKDMAICIAAWVDGVRLIDNIFV